jgi:hypothetical protein
MPVRHPKPEHLILHALLQALEFLTGACEVPGLRLILDGVVNLKVNRVIRGLEPQALVSVQVEPLLVVELHVDNPIPLPALLAEGWTKGHPVDPGWRLHSGVVAEGSHPVVKLGRSV